MRILDIVPGTSVDGPGLRTAIYVAGCSHRCPGCHNPQSWDFEAGREMSVESILKEIEENDFDVTLTGGDPMYSAEEILPLVSGIKDLGKDIWLYTGFRYEEIANNEKMSKLLPYLDVIVDGPFIESERDIHILFRGSRNQRLIDVKKSTPTEIVEWEW